MMTRSFIPFHKYSMDHEEEEAVIQTLRSGWITRGPRVQAFEQEFQNYTHAQHALALNSCTAGLHLALLALNLQPGDEVITTSLTFVATVNMILASGAVPVFADIDPETLNISVTAIEKVISPRTKVIIPVHLAGQPCDMEPIMALARAHGIYVIEDAAHAVGSEYYQQRIGSIADMTVFSFYANKNITTGEGGMLTTEQTAWAERLRPLSLHGLSKDAWKRFSDGEYKHYLVEEPGYKYNMTDLQAALGLVQLKKCDQFLEKRRLCAEYYAEHLAGLPLKIPRVIPNIRHSHHLFIILLQTEQIRLTRDQLITHLHQAGIGSAVHYIPVHLHPFYRKRWPEALEHLPFVTDISDRILSLPLFPDLQRADQDYILEVLSDLLKQHQI